MLMACTRLLEARPPYAFFDHGACKRWYFKSVRAETISNYVSMPTKRGAGNEKGSRL